MKDISEELLKMQAEDQESLKNDTFQGVSRIHTERLKQIIDKVGWPSISEFGREASFAAWLIAQHSDFDPEFQKQCLKLMLGMQDDVEKRNIAYLTDRILVNKGQAQIYGTQFYINKSGEFGPRPIRDIDKLDNLWKEMGLAGPLWSNFQEYEKYMNQDRMNKNTN